MTAVKLVYVGGGSTRAPGTMASLVAHGERLRGSEVVLVDLDAGRLELVRRLGRRMAAQAGVDLTVLATTDRRSALDGCDYVLTSFRPGGFAARVLDERIPLRHGLIGQETHGAGGFFMALRSVAVMKALVAEMAAVCPGATILNYTNPVNIVSEALSRGCEIPIVSFCEGPIVYPRAAVAAAGLDPARLRTASAGLNHAFWSLEHCYDGRDAAVLVAERWAAMDGERERLPGPARRMLELTAAMGSFPSEYWQYTYFRDEVLAEQRARRTTRAEDIIAQVPSYWAHYEEQAALPQPRLDPARSRGGIDELELAVEALEALAGSEPRPMPLNVPNRGSLPGFPDDLVVEVPGIVDGDGARPLPQPPLPRHLVGQVEALAEYQRLAAEAAWDGGARDACRALMAHPQVLSPRLAERVYADLARAHAAHLPERLRVPA